jgi:hypothetical protein
MRLRATSYVESAPCCGKGLKWSVELSGGWRVERARESREAEAEEKVIGEKEYSRLAFFDVCIFVTASEGEELIVDIIGRHGEMDSRGFREGFCVVESMMEAETVSLRLP